MTALQREEVSTSSNGRIVPFKMAHLVLQCADRKTVVDWYRKLFQAELVFEDQVLTFITFDEEHHRLAFFNSPHLADRPADVVGVHHIAYSYRSIGDLLSTYDRLKPLGILPVWSINHGPTTSLYFCDPEGNNIELQVDNFPDQYDAAAFFKTEIFANNPIGIEFDPDQLFAMWRNGVSDAELCTLGTAATGQSLGPQKR